MYHKLELNDVWFLRYEVWQNALVLWGHFLPFYSTNNPKNQNFEKMKKQTWRYHHFTQAYQKSWPYAILFLDMTYDKCKCYFSFWAIFCPFTPLTARKIKMKKNEKSPEISSLYTGVPKIMIRWCMVPVIWCTTDGRMDRQKEKVTYKSGCPPKKNIALLLQEATQIY